MKNNNLPNFSAVVPQKVTQQLQQLLDQNRQDLKAVLLENQTYTWENLMYPLEDLEDKLHHFWSPVSHLNAVANNPAIREAYNAGLPLLTDYHTEIGHNQALYKAVIQLSQSQEYSQFNAAQQMAIQHLLRDFKLAGVSLPSAEKNRFAEISKELSHLGTRFEENLLDATEGWIKHITDPFELQGLPEVAIHAALAAAEQRKLTGWDLF